MSAANQVRLLSLNVQQLSATLGQGLVSAIAPVIGWLNGLIKRLIQAAMAFRTFMWTLFGKPLAAVRGLVDDTAGYLDDAAGAASDLGSAGGGAADGLGSAGSAAKDLKKQLTLLPFDQLNQLAKDTDSAGSGGSGGGGGGGGGIGGLGDMGDLGIMPDLGDALTDSPVINAVNQWAARIREAFQKQQWSKLGYIVAEGINAGFQYIYDALNWAKLKPIIVDGFIIPFQKVINSMMDGIDWNLIGKTFGRGLMDIVYTLRAWITGFKWREYGVDFAEGLNGFIDEIHPDQIGRLIADKFKAAWDFFGGWVSTFDFSGLGYSLRDGLVAFIDELDPKDMGESLGKFLNGIADTILAFLGDESVKESLASSFAEFVNGFIKELDAPKIKEALKSVSNTIFGALKQAFHEIDIMPLVGDIVTILSGLPWSFIWKSILAHATLSLGKALAGGIFSKVLTDALVAAFTGGGGAGAAAGVAAKTTTTATVASATSGGAAATGGATAAAGLGAGGLGALASVLAPLAGLAVVMRKQVNKTGGVGQFRGQNLAPSYQQPKQAPVSSGQSNTGYSPKVQTAPITPSPQTQTPISIPDIIANVKTTLFGQKDPSFTNLELAKSSLLQTPIVKKIMNGELTSGFKDGYKKFTDTKSYNAVKGFGASVSQTFKTWWSRNVDKKNYNSTKGMNASIGGTFSTWWWRNTDKSNYSSTKSMNASIGDNFRTWWGRNTDQYSYPATKSMNARDAGRFVSFTDLWKSIKDKWVDINVSIVKKTSDLGAWIKGKWEELVSFEWFARGGLFTSATAIPVFGEAGAEAAIPLERKSTMKRIASAIVDSGGMGTSNSDDIANAVAERLAPIIMSAVNDQNSRPINVNATLYTENNEVLARAVNQGNKSLDKRYNPVSQYSY